MMPMQILFLIVAIFALNVSGFHLGFKPSSYINRSELVMRERKCDITGARRNSDAMLVSKSNRHVHTVQNVNLQTRKLWWEEGNKFIRIRITTRTLKTIQKNGLDATAKKHGIDLNKYSLSSGTSLKKEEVKA